MPISELRLQGYGVEGLYVTFSETLVLNGKNQAPLVYLFFFVRPPASKRSPETLDLVKIAATINSHNQRRRLATTRHH